MPEAWPATVPHKPDDDALQGVGFRAPLATDFEDGSQRRRRSTSRNIARLEMSINMTDAEFTTLKGWVRDVLVDGTLPFSMPIWTGAAYAARTCSFVEPYRFAPAGWGRQTVSMILDVEDY